MKGGKKEKGRKEGHGKGRSIDRGKESRKEKENGAKTGRENTIKDIERHVHVSEKEMGASYVLVGNRTIYSHSFQRVDRLQRILSFEELGESETRRVSGNPDVLQLAKLSKEILDFLL